MSYLMSGACRRAAEPGARRLHSAVNQWQPGPFAKLLWPLVWCTVAVIPKDVGMTGQTMGQFQ